jgi:hypothetical protein
MPARAIRPRAAGQIRSNADISRGTLLPLGPLPEWGVLRFAPFRRKKVVRPGGFEPLTFCSGDGRAPPLFERRIAEGSGESRSPAAMAAQVERNPAESSGVQRAARRAHCGHTGAEEVVRAVQRGRSRRLVGTSPAIAIRPTGGGGRRTTEAIRRPVESPPRFPDPDAARRSVEVNTEGIGFETYPAPCRTTMAYAQPAAEGRHALADRRPQAPRPPRQAHARGRREEPRPVRSRRSASRSGPRPRCSAPPSWTTS